jgi:hypothetical protein
MSNQISVRLDKSKALTKRHSATATTTTTTKSETKILKMFKFRKLKTKTPFIAFDHLNGS